MRKWIWVLAVVAAILLFVNWRREKLDLQGIPEVKLNSKAMNELWAAWTPDTAKGFYTFKRTLV